MPTLTWTGKEDALRAASLVPFRLLELYWALLSIPNRMIFSVGIAPVIPLLPFQKL